MPVPAGSKSRDLVVEIKKLRIKVGLKGKEPILEGELPKEIKVDDSTWTLGQSPLSCPSHLACLAKVTPG